MRGWRAAPPRCSCSSSGPKSSLSTSSAGTESWSAKTARAHRTRSPNAARPSGDKVLSPGRLKTRSASMTSREPYAASRAFAWEKSSDPCWRFPCALWAGATKTSVIAAATSSSRCRWASSHRCTTPLSTTTARAAVAPISAALRQWTSRRHSSTGGGRVSRCRNLSDLPTRQEELQSSASMGCL